MRYIGERIAEAQRTAQGSLAGYGRYGSQNKAPKQDMGAVEPYDESAEINT